MSVTYKEINGTVVNGVTAPRLAELKERPCTLPELQAALVQLIECFNLSEQESEKLAKRVDGKANAEWRATI